MINLFTCSLSASDIDAIIAALPILASPEFESTDEQLNRNIALALSATEKLLNRENKFYINEQRVMFGAVLAARDYLTGALPLDLDSELKDAISPYFFTYNKLYPHCQKALDEMEARYALSE